MRAITVECGNCGGDEPVNVLFCLAMVDTAGLLLMWPCVDCGVGWYRPECAANRALILASGARLTVAARHMAAGLRDGPTLLGTPPVWPETRARRAPLTRLAYRLGRRTNPT